ncbi:RPW8-like protein 3 [Bienertia sinuspersici]
MKQILTRPMQLADQITKATDEAVQFKPECLELQAKTKKLADLIRQATHCSNDLYDRPTRRIIEDTEQVLEKALALLDNSIGDVSWLLRVSTVKNDDDDADIGWRTCRRGRGGEIRCGGVVGVVARDNERYGKTDHRGRWVGVAFEACKGRKNRGTRECSEVYWVVRERPGDVEPMLMQGGDQPSPKIGGSGAVGLL